LHDFFLDFTTILTLARCYYLFFQPQILYGFDLWDHYAKQQTTPSEHVRPVVNISDSPTKDGSFSMLPVLPDVEEIGGGHYFSEELLVEVEKRVQRIMEDKRLYLNAGFRLKGLSAETGFSVHKVSAYINMRCKTNFSGFLNRYRIQAVLKLMATGVHRNQTLEALGQQCGFQSRATFIRAFKAHTGFTPSEYPEHRKPDAAP
jgi:AraC-like DNA-binding protein